MPLQRMLRIHCLQLSFNLSEPAVKEALYASIWPIRCRRTRRQSAKSGICLSATFCTRIFQDIGRSLQSQGLRVSSGTIVDATNFASSIAFAVATSKVR